jgi:hypothetical protein
MCHTNLDTQIISENSKIFSGNISFPSADHETSDDSLTATTSSTLPRNWFKRWFVDWWLTEIISWGFGVVCMIIIATVLSKYDGKQDPKWKTGITIGSFISIFSGLAKSALLLPTAEGKSYNCQQ